MVRQQIQIKTGNHAMGWYIQGTDFHFDIRVDKNGLSVSGEGSQVFKSSLDPLEIKIDMNETKTLPASWSIYRAAQAGELASTLSLDVQEMKGCLDAAVVRTTTRPVGVIAHHYRLDAANPRHIGFSAFLPDEYFENVWELLKLFSAGTTMRYWMSFDFIGFIPHRVAEHPEVLSYDDWLAGRPCLSEDFAFGLAPATRTTESR
jgi:hypothetical protein